MHLIKLHRRYSSQHMARQRCVPTTQNTRAVGCCHTDRYFMSIKSHLHPQFYWLPLCFQMVSTVTDANEVGKTSVCC